MYKDIYYDDIFFNPTGLKHAQKLITSENYYKRIIEKSYHIYKKLEIIETDTLLGRHESIYKYLDILHKSSRFSSEEKYK